MATWNFYLLNGRNCIKQRSLFNIGTGGCTCKLSSWRNTGEKRFFTRLQNGKPVADVRFDSRINSVVLETPYTRCLCNVRRGTRLNGSNLHREQYKYLRDIPPREIQAARIITFTLDTCLKAPLHLRGPLDSTLADFCPNFAPGLTVNQNCTGDLSTPHALWTIFLCFFFYWRHTMYRRANLHRYCRTIDVTKRIVPLVTPTPI